MEWTALELCSWSRSGCVRLGNGNCNAWVSRSSTWFRRQVASRSHSTLAPLVLSRNPTRWPSHRALNYQDWPPSLSIWHPFIHVASSTLFRLPLLWHHDGVLTWSTADLTPSCVSAHYPTISWACILPATPRTKPCYCASRKLVMASETISAGTHALGRSKHSSQL